METINALSEATDRPKLHAFVNAVQTSEDWKIVPASQALFVQGLQFHRQYNDKDWSLTDCFSFVVMRDKGITQALTHDHHFEQAGFEALLRRDPS